MFGGDPFGGIFGDVHQQMRRQMQDMDNMMSSMMDPFGFNRRGMIENGRNRNQRQMNNDMALMSPFGGFGMGGLFGGIMRQMNDIQSNMMNDPNSHVYSHSTMITFDGNREPKIVEESMRKSGDVKETRHSVRNDSSGVGDRMSIEHTIGSRTHVIEKKRDREGRIREKQKFINLDEQEAEDFDREFTSRVRRNFGGEKYAHRAIDSGHSSKRPGHKTKSAQKTADTSRGMANAPIVTLPDEEYDDDDVQIMDHRNKPSSSRQTAKGPIIQEISEDEAEMTHAKRRKGIFGKLFKANDE